MANLSDIMRQRSLSGHKTAEEALATAERLGKVACQTWDGRYVCAPIGWVERTEDNGAPIAILVRGVSGEVVRDYRNWTME